MEEQDGYPLYLPGFTADPWSVYEQLRKQGPVVPVQLDPGVPVWMVLDYTTALEVLRSPETFSKDTRRWRALQAGELPPDSPVLPIMTWQPHPLYTEGEEHRRLRQVTMDSLARVDLHALRDYVGRQADRLVDTFAAAGEADLVRQYVEVLPVLIFGELCGASKQFSERLYATTMGVMDGVDAETSFAQMLACVAELVAFKRDRPGADVASWMLGHAGNLADEEIVSTLVLFMGYGGAALRILISNGLRLLLSDDRFAVGLSGGSVPVDDAIDELLWREPPASTNVPYFPCRNVKLGGVRLREGDPVFVSLAAANMDPSVAVESRSGNRAHLAWGAGPHTCPAQSQARLIATVAMETLLDRLPEIELAVPVDRLEWRPGPLQRTLAALPVRFPPAPLSKPAPPASSLRAAAGNAAARPDASPPAGSVPAPDAQTPDVPAPDVPAPAAAAHTDADADAAAGPVSGEPPRRAGGWFTAWWRRR